MAHARKHAPARAVLLLLLGLAGLAGAPVATASPVRAPLLAAEPGGGGMGEHTCDGCEPPLNYQGGRVMDTTGPGGVTITPIFWAPAGYAFPPGYRDLIVQYVEDIAADSGKSTNVYALLPEYAVKQGKHAQDLAYALTAGDPVTHAAAYPKSGCEPLEGFTACVTDAQLVSELRRIVRANALVTDLTHFYPVFFPPAVETMDLDGSNSLDGYCGYHRSAGEGSAQILYGNEPFLDTGCGQPHAPSGNLPADGAIGVLSHEIMEAITDPEDVTTWTDKTGHEIADICAEFYGPPLGYTDPAKRGTTGYNQEINGHRYFTQTEFSNAAFASFGNGAGCQQSAQAATASSAEKSPIGIMLGTANPNVLAADGKAVADIETNVSAPDGSAIVGDDLAFSTKIIQGKGECGTLSQTQATTDDQGFAKIIYTASTSDVVCGIVITDAVGGQAATAAMYQGSFADIAPKAMAAFPEVLEAGGDPATFDVTFSNPGDQDFTSAQVALVMFPAEGATVDVSADQVSLELSTKGSRGPYTPVEISGSTVTEGAINGYVDDVALAAGSSRTFTFRVAVDETVPSAKDPLLSMEAYLDVLNPATGAGTNLADTLSTPVNVRALGDGTRAPSSDQGVPGWLIAVAVGLLLIGPVAFLRLSRRAGAAAPRRSGPP